MLIGAPRRSVPIVSGSILYRSHVGRERSNAYAIGHVPVACSFHAVLVGIRVCDLQGSKVLAFLKQSDDTV